MILQSSVRRAQTVQRTKRPRADHHHNNNNSLEVLKSFFTYITGNSKMVTLELENDKTQEMPTLNNNSNGLNNKPDENNATCENNERTPRYLSLYIVFQIVGVLLVLFVLLWLQIYRGGYSFSETIHVCNWHPLLMTIALVYLFANSVLHFRNFRNVNKRELKMQHAIMHICTIILASLGLWAGLNSNTIANPPIPKFCSLHSWLGIATVVMFLFQFAGGFVCFLYPEIAVQYKKVIMPYHIFVGVLTFVLSVVTSVLGFSEKIIFALNQQRMSMEVLFLNSVSLILMIYGVLVVYLLIKPEYKRSSKPVDVPDTTVDKF